LQRTDGDVTFISESIWDILVENETKCFMSNMLRELRDAPSEPLFQDFFD